MVKDGETQTQFARRVGLSQTRIGQLVKDGLPLLSSGRIDVDSALTWLEPLFLGTLPCASCELKSRNALVVMPLIGAGPSHRQLSEN